MIKAKDSNSERILWYCIRRKGINFEEFKSRMLHEELSQQFGTSVYA